MKYTIILMLAIFLFNQQITAQCKIDYSNYTLVLDEKFDTYSGSVTNLLGPLSIWKAQFECPLAGWGVEYFDPSQVSLIPDGTGGHRLRLTAERLSTPIYNPTGYYDWCRSSKYTNALPDGDGKAILFKSGMLNLKNTASLPPISSTILDNTSACPMGGGDNRGWAYGMFEIRCKTPAGGSEGGDRGRWDTWPAVWLIGHGELDIIDDAGFFPSDPGKYKMSGKIDWTRAPEDNRADWDIVPYNSSYPNHQTDKEYLIGDYTNYGAPTRSYRANKNIAPLSFAMKITSEKRDFSTDFTTYTFVWTPNRITYFIEGREMYTLKDDYARLGNGCPLNFLVSLQMHPSATDPDVDPSTIYNMDIEYIKVYKPNQNNYNSLYKTDLESIYHDVFSNSTIAPVNVSLKPNSIAPNTSDPNEVFYRGQDDYIYAANKIGNSWSIKKLEYNDGSDVKAIGDIKYLADHDALIYAGSNDRINMFDRSFTEPCGFYHHYITSNWSCWWCVPDDKIKTSASSLQTTSDGTIYFIGLDDKIHRYKYNSSISNWEQYIFPNNNANGDITIDESTSAIYYKGTDSRIWSYWLSGSTYTPAAVPPTHISLTTSQKLNTQSNSLVWASSIGRLLYLGQDNKIQQFELIGSSWVHSWLPYTYASAPDGYPAGEFPRASLGWDNDLKRIHYGGNDGRLQLFGYQDPVNWWHWHTDDYWNTKNYRTFDNSAPSMIHPSIVVGNDGSEKSIFYTAGNGHLSYFKRETCEYEVTGHSAQKNLNRTTTQPLISSNSNETKKISYKVYPNPCRNILNIQSQDHIVISIFDVFGKSMIPMTSNQTLDLSDLASGTYILKIFDEKGNFISSEKISKLP